MLYNIHCVNYKQKKSNSKEIYSLVNIKFNIFKQMKHFNAIY